MDLMYMPDSITYPSFRSGNSYNFELQQQQQQTNYWDKPKHNVERPKQRSASASKEHKNCPMCKANQRRRLASYIRSKSRLDSEGAIEEEDEQDKNQQ